LNFHEALTAVYRCSPCEVLPNALWKTACQADQHKCSFQVEGESVSELCMWNQDRLLLYWKPDPKDLNFSVFGTPRLALVHQRALPYFPIEKYSHRTAYFRYQHSMKSLPKPLSIPGFELVEVEPVLQAEQITDFLNRCYPNMALDPKTILSWTRHPVFRSDLWIWLVDQRTKLPAALGIAEIDVEIGEGALEWIQVLPEYRRQGLGKVVVDMLLNRLQGTANFTTVSGEIENPTNPGMLYRKCGFEGDHIWWVFRNDP
jgi:GNAT superfamily N-acetyltransferase